MQIKQNKVIQCREPYYMRHLMRKTNLGPKDILPWIKSHRWGTVQVWNRLMLKNRYFIKHRLHFYNNLPHGLKEPLQIKGQVKD